MSRFRRDRSTITRVRQLPRRILRILGHRQDPSVDSILSTSLLRLVDHMCLAVPSRIVSISGTTAEVDIMGNRTFADLSVVDDAKVGDYVLVHAGMAIQKYDEDEARKTLELFRDIAALDMNQ